MTIFLIFPTCLDVLGDPPVVLGLEVADGDESVAGADCELILLGRPAHARRGAVDAQQHQGVPPLPIGLQKDMLMHIYHGGLSI